MARRTAEAARLGATWACRVTFSVRVAETATFGGIAPNNLAVAGKAYAIGACVVPMFQAQTRQIVRSENGVEEGETIFKGRKAPP